MQHEFNFNFKISFLNENSLLSLMPSEKFAKCCSQFLATILYSSSPSLFRYPSQVFVGDTFNYLSGMTFAVVGILGHFSKTILLFFIPQVLNFLYSVPQLFHFIPCPRHRLPKYDPETDLVSNSVTIFKESDLGVLGKIMFRILKILRMVNVKEVKDGLIECNNLTIINFFILFTGPIHESKLTQYLLAFQVLCSIFAFIIRYPLATFFYGS